MPKGDLRRKWLQTAAQVIDGRVAALKAEFATMEAKQSKVSNAADRAAIMEAEYCARLIRHLADREHKGDPYQAARERWNRGERIVEPCEMGGVS